MNISTDTQTHAEVAADILGIAVTEDTLDEAIAGLDAAFEGTLLTALNNDEFKPKAGSTASYPTFGKIAAKRLLVVGLGDGSAVSVQQAAGAVGKAARASGAKDVALDMGTLDAAQTQVAVEGFIAGNYKFDKYKTDDSKKDGVVNLTLLGDLVGASVAVGQAVAGGQSLARDLVNEPADAIYPESLAQVAKDLAND